MKMNDKITSISIKPWDDFHLDNSYYTAYLSESKRDIKFSIDLGFFIKTAANAYKYFIK